MYASTLYCRKASKIILRTCIYVSYSPGVKQSIRSIGVMQRFGDIRPPYFTATSSVPEPTAHIHVDARKNRIEVILVTKTYGD